MRKFKHIKTGVVVQQQGAEINNFYWGNNKNGHLIQITHDCVENSNDWIEIIEKDYEILSFILPKDNNSIKTLRSNGLYVWDARKDDDRYGGGVCLEYGLSLNDYKIHSIKRLSDGEVFKLKDNIETTNSHYKNIKIKEFIILDESSMHNRAISSLYHDYNIGKIAIIGETNPNGIDLLNNISHVKEISFITEDKLHCNLEISVYKVNTKEYTLINDIPSRIYPNDLSLDYLKLFYNKKAAIDYIIENKPCLSIKDLRTKTVVDIFDHHIKDIVKSKLNL